MTTVLVTGAAGNLGQSIVRKLLARGVRVRAFDLPTKANQKRLHAFGDNVELALGDITKPEDVARAVASVDAIAHLAGVLPPITERKLGLANAVNAEGTKNIIAAAEKAAPGCRLVFASSCSVYGFGQAARGIATSDSPTEGTDEYTKSKLAAEAALRASTLDWTILRVSAAALEGSPTAQDPMVIRLMFEYAADHPIELVHGEDVATAFTNALFEPGASKKILPIAGGESCRTTQRGLFELIFGMIGVKNLPESVHGNHPNYTCWMDTSESQRLLAYQSKGLEDIRRDMAAHLGMLVPLARLASPIVRLYLLRLSGPYTGEPPRPTWQDQIAAGH